MILKKEIQEITGLIEQMDAHNPEVSQVTVGWHFEHLLISICKVCKALELSDPSEYQWRFNKVRAYIFTRGSIPRGKGKAPKSVKIEAESSKEEFENLLAKAIEKLEGLESLHKSAHFEHPYFGDLNLKRTKYFIKLHTVHHLKIVRDILQS